MNIAFLGMAAAWQQPLVFPQLDPHSVQVLQVCLP